MENMDPEPYRVKRPESHSVPSRKAQTVLRTVPLNLNRTPYLSIKIPVPSNLSGKIYYFINVINKVNGEKLQIAIHYHK